MKVLIEGSLNFFKRQWLRFFFNPQKRFLPLALLLLGFSAWVPQPGYCQHRGYKYIRNYSPGEYYGHSQNWSILQDNRGIIYVANRTDLLEFDGISWRKIKVPNIFVSSLGIDDKSIIYVGGIDEIGFLAPDEEGALHYVSLLDHIDEDKRNFSRVWKIFSEKEYIYFRTMKFIFRWSPGLKEMKVLDSKDYQIEEFSAFFTCDEKLYVRDDKKGLMQIVEDRLNSIPGGERFATKKIYMMVPYDSNINPKSLLIGTREEGFFIYDANTIKPFPTEVDDYVRENQLYYGIRLSSGDFALPTLRGGVIIMDPKGRKKHRFTKTYGLQDDDVKCVFEDSTGNIWLALNKGISKIEYENPISVFDDRTDLPGIVLSVTRHGPNNNLYAGTSRGLYFLSSTGKFVHIPGIPGQCYSLLSVVDALLVATTDGVFQVEKNITKSRVVGKNSYVLHQSKKDRNRIWVGTRQGLASLFRQKSGYWAKEREFEKDQEIMSIVEDQKGNLWLGTTTKGVIKVILSISKTKKKISKYFVKKYYKSHQLPLGEVHVFKAAGRVLFGTESGLFFFDEEKNHFIPDSRFGDEFAGGSRNVFRLAEDKNKNIWFYSTRRNFQAIHTSAGKFALNRKPSIIPPVQVHAIYPDPGENVIWFASDEGLIRYDTRLERSYAHDFSVLIRQVLVNGSEVIFGGYKRDFDKTPERSLPRLAYDERNLHFEFAAPFFKNELAIKYQYLLEGLNNQWSELNQKTNVDYPKLDPGQYTFRVKAENAFGNLSDEAVFQFKILLPWYKTWWAFLSYLLLAFLIIYPIIVKWRSWKLHQEKQRLEQVVKERTKEINEKKQQLEKQTVQLQEQSEKLKELDHVKSRFFANISHEFRTPLTLIMGPLEQMLADNHEDEQVRKNNVKLMLRNSQRLLNLINQLLDLSKLDSGKMRLQAVRQNMIPFLKGILDSFHFLATQNKLDLIFNSKKENITFYFDREKLEKVICNLVSNAIKFTPAGGKITVTISSSSTPAGSFPSGCAEISVTDTGVGIPREQLDHIFDRFYQAGVSGENEQKGSGIGLALTKELVTLHHGEIHVKSSDGSEGGSRGTEFILRFPLGTERLKPEEMVDGSEISSQPQKTCEVSPLYTVETEAIEKENEQDVKEKDLELETQEKEIILVVEDSHDVRKYIRGPLETHYTVLEAVNGKDGMEKAREIIPDLIISDIMMPEADGYELCSVLKQDVLTCHIPIILLTAKASEENIVQGLETGADDYITKPFNTKILMARIRNLIELRRQLQGKMKRQMMLQPAEISVSSIDEEFIKELQRAIEKNLSDPEFSVEELGKKLYMSRASLYRKIQALTGESPNHFIRSYRLKRAAQLLKENFGNVTEIAFEVGFSSSAYFTKCFKEQFQQLPSSYQASEAS